MHVGHGVALNAASCQAGAHRFVPQYGIQVSKKQNITSVQTRFSIIE